LDYVERDTPWLPQVGLGVTLWQGTYEGKYDMWLRWCDENENLILTGAENAAQERQAKEQVLFQKEQVVFQLEHERHAKEQALSQLEQLSTKLRALGIDPNSLLQQ
jgi:hypothetical protein